MPYLLWLFGKSAKPGENLAIVMEFEDLRGEIAFETYGAAMLYSEYDDGEETDDQDSDEE